MELNKTGAWIMIIKDMHLEIPIDRLSIYYAKPKGKYLKGYRETYSHEYIMKRAWRLGLDGQEYNDCIYEYLDNPEEPDIYPKALREEIKFEISKHDYTKEDFVNPAEIVTPFGEATIYPEEYNEVGLDYALELVNQESHVIRYLSNDGSIRKDLKQTSIADKVFYLRSRGITYTEAMKRISGDIKTQYLMYFDPLPQYIHCYERNFLKLAEKKIEYCKENGYEQLLSYKATEDGNPVEFTLRDFINHITKKETA